MTKEVTKSEPRELTKLDTDSANPMMLIAHLVQSGDFDAGKVDVMKALIEMRDQEEAKEARKAFFDALADFKAECPPIYRNKDVVVKGAKRYDYATIDEVEATIEPHLKAHWLFYRSNQELLPDGKLQAEILISHRGGHTEVSRFSGPTETPAAMSPIQKIGSAYTYSYRIALCRGLGLRIVGMPDDDGDMGRNEPITEEQAAEIDRLIVESGSNIEIFLGVYGVGAVSLLTVGAYEDAKLKLEQKLRKAKR